MNRHRLAVAVATGALALGAVASAGAAAPADHGPAAAAVDQLGAGLHQVLAAADPAGNLVISPLSISAAMAMASAGAAGDTLAEMQAVLGLTMADPHAAMGGLLAAIEAAGGGSLALANSLWSQQGLTVDEAFQAVLRDAYGAELQLADFAADPEAARAAVNGWVADATARRITELLGPGAVQPDTRLVLVNAVYLDAQWVSPFEADATYVQDFTTAAGTVVPVEFMHQTLYADHVAGDGFQALTLPYTAGYEMVVVLPDAGGLAAFEQRYADAGGDLATVLGPTASREVVLALPKWDIATNTSMVTALQALGLELPFSAAADFSAITTDEPLKIDDVVHQANITVDELGTEAAAATAVIMAAGAAPPEEEPLEFTVDRPFFFAVRDTATGTVIFAGHVNDPS